MRPDIEKGNIMIYFTIIRAPYTVPLLLKRETMAEILAEFPDAEILA